MIDLNSFGSMTNHIQPQDIQLVTPVRSRPIHQMEAFEAVKKLPYMLQGKGFNGVLHFKVYFSELVNLIEDGEFGMW